MTTTLENSTDIPVGRLITLAEAETRLHGLVKALTLRGWLGTKLTCYRLGSRILVDAAEVDGLITRAGAREVA